MVNFNLPHQFSSKQTFSCTGKNKLDNKIIENNEKIIVFNSIKKAVKSEKLPEEALESVSKNLDKEREKWINNKKFWKII